MSNRTPDEEVYRWLVEHSSECGPYDSQMFMRAAELIVPRIAQPSSKPLFLRFGRISAHHAADDVVFLVESEVMPYIERLTADRDEWRAQVFRMTETITEWRLKCEGLEAERDPTAGQVYGKLYMHCPRHQPTGITITTTSPSVPLKAVCPVCEREAENGEASR